MQLRHSIQSLQDTSGKRKLLLLLLSLALLGGVYCIPIYHEWFNDKPIDYWKDFTRQYKNLDEENRRIERWGNQYVVSKIVVDMLPKNGKRHLLLVPSPEYFKAKGFEYDVPEPIVFYYFTSVNTTWSKYSDAKTATSVILVNDKKQLVMHNNIAPAKMDSLIKALNKYPYPL